MQILHRDRPADEVLIVPATCIPLSLAVVICESPQSPLSILKRRAEERGETIAFRVLRHGRQRFDSFQDMSWKDFYERTLAFATYFQSLALTPGARIGIWGKNSVDWLAADWALMVSGFVTVPLYPQSTLAEVQWILRETEAELLLTDEVSASIDCRQISLSDLEILAQRNQETLPFVPPELDLDRVATIMFTSGTSGQPKGVMHSLRNGFLAVESANQRVKITENDILFSYLPLSHIAERVLIQWSSLMTGACACLLDRVERLMTYLPLAKPTIFLGVPRVWDTMASRLSRELGEKRLGWLSFFPVAARSFLMKRLVLKRMGLDRVRYFISGAAKLNKETFYRLRGFGILISEGYGLTETMGLSALNERKTFCGTVGKPFQCVEVRIAGDGEICLRAPFHFLGYYKNHAETSQALQNGWFHTGDMGYFDDKGVLTITDRKKNLFKTSNGKYIAPQVIELRLKAYEGVQEAVVIGENRAYCVALLNLSPQFSDDAQLEAHLKGVNRSLAPHEQIKALGCFRGAWSIDSGEMTPTYKLKRRVVEERFQPQIEQLFESSRFLNYF